LVGEASKLDGYRVNGTPDASELKQKLQTGHSMLNAPARAWIYKGGYIWNQGATACGRKSLDAGS